MGAGIAGTEEFLRAMQPEYDVIPVGADNMYGHPHAEVLERLAKAGSKVLRTDRMGTIVFESDGKKVTLTALSATAAGAGSDWTKTDY